MSFSFFCELVALAATGWFVIEAGAGRWYKWAAFGLLALSWILPQFGMVAPEPVHAMLLLSRVAFVVQLGLAFCIGLYWLDARM